MSRLPVCVAGTGLSAPAEVLTSEVLERSLGLEPAWIARRTGVLERRIAPPDVAVSDLAVAAGEQALQASGIDRSEVSLLILATSTPDHPLPPTAPAVAARLGLTVPAFDLGAACTGFLYGYAVAARWLAAPGIPHQGDAALVIGANVLSRRVNWSDPDTAPLFGDGAGAVVLRHSPGSVGGVLGIDLASDGHRWREIHVPAGGSRLPITNDTFDAGGTLIVMEDGKRLFRHAVYSMAASCKRVLGNTGVTPGEICWFAPHQAGSRLIHDVAVAVGISRERVIANVERYGNTSAASIPMALHEAVADGRIQRGHLVLFAAVGAGMTAGSVLLRWE